MTAQAQAGGAVATACPGSLPQASGAGLPDVNAEIHPYRFVQQLLDHAATFAWFAIPDREYAASATLTPEDPDDWFGLNGGYGIAFRSALHRFSSLVQPPSFDIGVTTAQAVGEAEGELCGKLLFGTPELEWAPGRNPPPAIFDLWEPRRFTMEADFVLPHGQGFHGYGLGRTYPLVVHGCPRLLIAAVGNLVQGAGKLAGLEASFVLTGTLTHLGILANVICRVVDPRGIFRTGRDLPPVRPAGDPDPGSTFIALRGVKRDRNVKTTYGAPPDAHRVSLITPSQMRAIDLRSASRRPGGPFTSLQVGPAVGSMEATVFFDLLRPPGTAADPH